MIDIIKEVNKIMGLDKPSHLYEFGETAWIKKQIEEKIMYENEREISLSAQQRGYLERAVVDSFSDDVSNLNDQELIKIALRTTALDV